MLKPWNSYLQVTKKKHGFSVSAKGVSYHVRVDLMKNQTRKIDTLLFAESEYQLSPQPRKASP